MSQIRKKEKNKPVPNVATPVDLNTSPKERISKHRDSSKYKKGSKGSQIKFIDTQPFCCSGSNRINKINKNFQNKMALNYRSKSYNNAQDASLQPISQTESYMSVFSTAKRGSLMGMNKKRGSKMKISLLSSYPSMPTVTQDDSRIVEGSGRFKKISNIFVQLMPLR